ncbi:MAG: triose-phosphate isomerase [Desulfobacterales bacterium]|nr:triose-phosphate isomerase [Desulfobacterales bacterium]MBF0398151.1 triose-phosphate isomerase [Desulfobacterales bacterium]
MKNRKPLLAGNWKMYKTCAEAVDTAKKLAELVTKVQDRDIMIAPPFTALFAVSEVLKNTNISIGSQNIFWEKEGAYTGEVSGQMLVSCGCKYVIIGHSERRQYFHETDETVNKRIKSALLYGLIPVFCVGETEKERESNETFSVLDKQVQNGLKDFTLNDLKTLVIAYEPVWAIGTGKTATSAQAQEVHAFIRSLIEKKFDADLASKMRILYGGSVKPENISELMSMPDVDGGLVGGASLKPETFSKIVTYN